MKKYLFIGGEFDGKFVETNGEPEFIYQFFTQNKTESWVENEKPEKPINIRKQVYKKSFVAKGDCRNIKKVVFYANKNIFFDEALSNRVFELTKNI